MKQQLLQNAIATKGTDEFHNAMRLLCEAMTELNVSYDNLLSRKLTDATAIDAYLAECALLLEMEMPEQPQKMPFSTMKTYINKVRTTEWTSPENTSYTKQLHRMVSHLENGYYILQANDNLFAKGSPTPSDALWVPDFIKLSEPIMFRVKDGEFDLPSLENRLLALASWENHETELWKRHCYPNGSNYYNATFGRGETFVLKGADVRIIKGGGSREYRTQSDWVEYKLWETNPEWRKA